MGSASPQDPKQAPSRPALSTTITASSYGSVTITSTESMSSVSTPSSQQSSFLSLRQTSVMLENLLHNRSRSKSPAPPISIPGTALQSPQTSPVTAQAPLHPKNRRTTSDSAIVPPTDFPKRSHIVQRSKSPACSTGHYGRHSNEWLFHNISIRETVKHFVRGDDEHK